MQFKFEMIMFLAYVNGQRNQGSARFSGMKVAVGFPK